MLCSFTLFTIDLSIHSSPTVLSPYLLYQTLWIEQIQLYHCSDNSIPLKLVPAHPHFTRVSSAKGLYILFHSIYILIIYARNRKKSDTKHGACFGSVAHLFRASGCHPEHKPRILLHLCLTHSHFLLRLSYVHYYQQHNGESCLYARSGWLSLMISWNQCQAPPQVYVRPPCVLTSRPFFPRK